MRKKDRNFNATFWSIPSFSVIVNPGICVKPKFSISARSEANGKSVVK